VEPEIIAVFDVEALIGTQERIQPRRHPSRETEYVAPDRSTQCFNCSRIYFDQALSRCPHCNSDSLQHYTTADLNHFAHNGVRESF
jgi:predicted Zn-ribbon and HTH transcriptional regulator